MFSDNCLVVSMGDDTAKHGQFDVCYQERLVTKKPLNNVHQAIIQVAKFSRNIGPNHFHVADALLELADARMQLGNPIEAVPMLEQSLAIFEKEHGRDSIGATKVMRLLGVAKSLLGEVGAAIALLKQARTIFETKFGPSHPQTETTNSVLARVEGSFADVRPCKKPRVE